MKTARFLRVLQEPSHPTDDERKCWWVSALLFKVSPAIIYTDGVTYRKGKMLHDGNRVPHRYRSSLTRLRDADGNWAKPNPIYSHGYRERSTAFVISSAADLKSMMARSSRRMREIAQARLEYYEAMNPSKYRDEGIEREKTTINLFSEDQDMRFEVETYLFPSDKFGNNKSYGELAGSQKGTLDHCIPLADIGYTIINEIPLIVRPREPIILEVDKDHFDEEMEREGFHPSTPGEIARYDKHHLPEFQSNPIKEE